MSPEKRFLDLLVGFEADAKDCAIFGYTDFTIDYMAGADPIVLDRLNDFAVFWNTVSASLQSSMFVSLGRVYYESKGNHTANRLLAFAENNVGIFSRAALLERKRGQGLSAGLAEQFVSDAYEPVRESFTDLRCELEKRLAIFKKEIGPIRHNVFAHRGTISRAEREALFTDVLKRTLEDMLVFPVRFHRALWHLFYNGKKPELPVVPQLINDVMDNLPDEYTSTHEHMHLAKETRDLLLWIKDRGGTES